MAVTTPRTWQDLARVVSEGQDSEKLMELVGRLNLLTLARQVNRQAHENLCDPMFLRKIVRQFADL
jgi:hypothetical protein